MSHNSTNGTFLKRQELISDEKNIAEGNPAKQCFGGMDNKYEIVTNVISISQI